MLNIKQFKQNSSKLSERERTILELHYGVIDGHGKSLSTIGRILGMDSAAVDRIENMALKKINIKVIG